MLPFVQINHILYVFYVFFPVALYLEHAFNNKYSYSTINSTIMGDRFLYKPNDFQFCSKKGKY